MFVLGIVGGVASGKSFIAAGLQERGAIVLNADQVGHEVLRDPAVVAAFRQRWGESVLDTQGQIIRSQVAAQVFGDTPAAAAERAFLDSITHPRIRARLQAKLAAEIELQTPLVVLDAALLFETGWDALCQGVLFVDTPRDVRLARAIARGWTALDFTAREHSQWSIEEKRRRSRWIILNDSTPAAAQSRLEHFYQQELLPAMATPKS
jgi:dephospho-CoA kinase